MIVFAHGFDVDPNTYRALLVSWVAAGYVVVAPFFPDTSVAAIEAQHGVDTESDEFNQPGDVAFVVSQVVEAGHGTAPPYAAYLVGLVDPSRLILAGQSDGADTVAALLYDHAYAATLASMGAQPRAVALLSGAEWTREEDVYSAPPGGGPPVLVVQSLTDACNDPADSSELYNMLTGTKWFLALDDATHLGPYVGLSDGAADSGAGDGELLRPRDRLEESGTCHARARRRPAGREQHHERRERSAVPGPCVRGRPLLSASGSPDGLTVRPASPGRLSRPRRDDADVRRGGRRDAPVTRRRLRQPLGEPRGRESGAAGPRRRPGAARRFCSVQAPADVVFTSGGTEADNLAVFGTAAGPGTVLCSAVEHPAVLEACLAAGGRIVAVDRRGVIDLDALADALDEKVRLVSVMLVNNETGVRQPLEAVVALVHERAPQALVHTDAVQAFGWLDVAAVDGRGRPRERERSQVRRPEGRGGARDDPGWRAPGRDGCGPCSAVGRRSANAGRARRTWPESSPWRLRPERSRA